jgi:hypothetical protein
MGIFQRRYGAKQSVYKLADQLSTNSELRMTLRTLQNA